MEDVSAVHVQRLTGDHARQIRGEEHHAGGAQQPPEVGPASVRFQGPDVVWLAARSLGANSASHRWTACPTCGLHR